MHNIILWLLCVSYEPFLTLSVPEVNCERTFGKLKLVKTRLGANLSKENLEAIWLMSVKKEWLNEVDVSGVIEYLKSNSTVMFKMFSL